MMNKGTRDQKIAPHADLPPTALSQSGSGGKHFIYQYSPKADGIKNLRQNIDIKSEHGYIILPPSLHYSGNHYKWLDECETTPFPEHLLQPKTGLEAIASNRPIGDIIFGAGVGGRNIAAAQMAGLCLKMKLTREEVYQFMYGWNQHNDPPLSNYELKSVIQSIEKADARNKSPEVAGEDILIHLQEASELHKKEYDGVFFPTGFDHLDKQVKGKEVLKGGIRVGDLGVIAGHSGHGKTLVAQVISSAITKSTPVVWFEYELMPDELWEKFEVMGVTNLDKLWVPKTMRGGQMEWIEEKIIEGVSKGARLFFFDVLDFLQPKMEDDRRRVSMNTASYVTLVCQQLKQLAKIHKVANVLMVHTRKPPQGANKEPDEFDLKDSGGIMQHSDWVLMIHRLNKKELNEVMGGKKTEDKNKPQRTTSFSEDFEEDEDDTEYSKLKLRKNRRTGNRPTFLVKFENGRLNEVTKNEDVFEQLKPQENLQVVMPYKN
jgi:replicative DNA helicase